MTSHTDAPHDREPPLTPKLRSQHTKTPLVAQCSKRNGGHFEETVVARLERCENAI